MLVNHSFASVIGRCIEIKGRGFPATRRGTREAFSLSIQGPTVHNECWSTMNAAGFREDVYAAESIPSDRPWITRPTNGISSRAVAFQSVHADRNLITNHCDRLDGCVPRDFVVAENTDMR